MHDSKSLNKFKLSNGYNSVLIISDTHFPYQHKSTLPFLTAIKTKYNPDYVIHIGDEIDQHSMSFHDKDPDLMSPGYELKKAIAQLEPLYELFPKMDILESNHGSLVFRKGKHHGFSRSVFKTYQQILKSPDTWIWKEDLKLLCCGKSVYFCHGKSKNPGQLSRNMGMNTVQGHYHSIFQIFYWSNPENQFFDMSVGCLIDDTSMAMAYNKISINRPLLGCAIILNGTPKLLPMVLDKKGLWNRSIP